MGNASQLDLKLLDKVLLTLVYVGLPTTTEFICCFARSFDCNKYFRTNSNLLLNNVNYEYTITRLGQK